MRVGGRGGDPVFVDGTGRRRRLLVVAGSVGGLVLVLAVLALLAGFTGVGPGSAPGWPGAGQVQRAVPKPDSSGSISATGDPSRGAAAATATPAGVSRSTTAGTAVPRTTPAAPPPTAPAPAATSHRKVPTQTPTAHPSKRH
ncbi:hypothetical protein [Rugosimonospora africana]|uniref:hypothetical protein n=1 Tax=Rugosimonospora africana TaxID=556532 RepID=UPI0019425C68|nr:hypothetical protein [Rugosimonospora africana]